MSRDGEGRDRLGGGPGLARPHINPKFSPKRGSTAPRVHVNPNFAHKEASGISSSSSSQFSTAPPLPQTAPPMSAQAHLNPKFKIHQQLATTSSSSSSHNLNPNYAHRPLPSIPTPTSSMRPEKPARSTRPRPASQYSYTSSQYSIDRRTDPIYASIKQPGLKLDAVKQAEYEASIRAKVASASARVQQAAVAPPSKPARNSLAVEDHQKLSPSEKENQPSSSSVKPKTNIFTPLRNSAAFKKFGSRKLVRVKSPGSTPTTSFKKIGSKKLIRITEKSVPSTSRDKNSPSYQVKTKTKIVKSVKDTPSNRSKYKFSFITPLANRKSRYLTNSSSGKKIHSTGGRKSLSSFRTRFKLDRRSKTKTPVPQVLFKNSSGTKLKRLSGSTYKVSATKLQKVPANSQQQPVKPGRSKYRAKLRTVNPGLAASKVITVQGVKFAVGDNGKKLKRLPSSKEVASSYSASVSHQTTPPGLLSTPPGLSSPHQEKITQQQQRPHGGRVYLGGEELEEVEPGVFLRSRHSLTRQSITDAKNRSINIILKNQNRSKQYCMFFNKFGKCTKKEKGSCPFLHDPDKVAVCRRFLQGACVKNPCLLSHRVAPEKMPVCKFFLEGLCTREDCPYLHTKVSAEAAICSPFLRGYCPNGSDCRQRHVMACPEFDRTGLCKAVGRCPFPHVDRSSSGTGEDKKKVAPVKPKRKSLGKTPECSKKSKVAAEMGVRYYAEQKKEEKLEDEEEDMSGAEEMMETKRKRLLRKIELAKQGWTGVTVTPAPDGNQEDELGLDESGPNEQVPGEVEEEEEVSRPPVGTLGDFISLAGYSSEEEEVATANGNHRLI